MSLSQICDLFSMLWTFIKFMFFSQMREVFSNSWIFFYFMNLFLKACELATNSWTFFQMLEYIQIHELFQIYKLFYKYTISTIKVELVVRYARFIFRLPSHHHPSTLDFFPEPIPTSSRFRIFHIFCLPERSAPPKRIPPSSILSPSISLIFLGPLGFPHRCDVWPQSHAPPAVPLPPPPAQSSNIQKSPQKEKKWLIKKKKQKPNKNRK